MWCKWYSIQKKQLLLLLLRLMALLRYSFMQKLLNGLLKYWMHFLVASYWPLSPISQVWNIGSPAPSFSLEGHSKGVNCVGYFVCGDKTSILSGSDDHTAKVCKQIIQSFFLVIYMLYRLSNTIENNDLMETAGMGLSNQKLCANTRRTYEQCHSSLCSSRASHNNYSFWRWDYSHMACRHI